jgi:CubicO group peptidase (beta-lactamase class C family)
LNGEVLRRIAGVPVGEFLRSQIAGRLGADIFVGLSPDEIERTAETIPPQPLEALLFSFSVAVGGQVRSLAFTNPPRPLKAVNTLRWRQAQIPSSNGHASARGLARLYTPLALGGAVNSVRLLSETNVERASHEQVHAIDVVTGTWVRRTLGFMLPEPESGDPRPLSAFGHPGMGGSYGFADPDRQLAMGYVMNRMIFGPDTRFYELCRAVYACLEAVKSGETR